VSTSEIRLPTLMPMLSRGKHRSPRKGACFMELASLLAGERWTDHPSCTHPLLATLARDVNDWTSDAHRHQLAGLIPSVIGLTSHDLHVDAGIALRCATTALPVASAERQRVMAVAVLACERVIADLDGRPPGSLGERSRSALAQVPDAARWAVRFAADLPVSQQAFRRRGAPSIVNVAVEGIAKACVPAPDKILRELLASAIDDCAAWVRLDTDTASARNVAKRSPAAASKDETASARNVAKRSPAAASKDETASAGFDPAAWTAACRLTGTTVRG
jgi:hypothetical protein